jgi:hypothetical protein
MELTREKVEHEVQKLDPKAPGSSWVAVAFGVASALITFFIYFGLQRIFRNMPASQIVDAMQGSANTLCFAGVTSAATIMPLMLTIFSFARQADVRFDEWFYDRVKNIGVLCVVAFISGLFTLTVLSAPIGENLNVSSDWYVLFYYVSVSGLCLMVGALTSILVMLFFAILHIIYVLNPHREQDTD